MGELDKQEEVNMLCFYNSQKYHFRMCVSSIYGNASIMCETSQLKGFTVVFRIQQNLWVTPLHFLAMVYLS